MCDGLTMREGKGTQKKNPHTYTTKTKKLKKTYTTIKTENKMNKPPPRPHLPAYPSDRTRFAPTNRKKSKMDKRHALNYSKTLWTKIHESDAAVHAHNEQADFDCSLASIPQGVPLPRNKKRFGTALKKMESKVKSCAYSVKSIHFQQIR